VANLTFRAAVPGDADTLLRELRDCDRREAEAAAGVDRVDFVLRYTVGASLAAWCCEQDGQLVALFGVASLSVVGGVGVPWMMGTDRLDRLPRAVMTQTRAYIPHMLVLFPHLTNFVDARNQRSIRLLKWLGFELHPAAPYGVQGLPFHRFEMRG
jgi:hypothetical protein